MLDKFWGRIPARMTVGCLSAMFIDLFSFPYFEFFP